MKKKILVVDDDVQLCQLCCDILEEHGFQPLSVNSTDDGFKKIDTFQPDLIVLDVWLPTIGGFEFCRQVRLDEGTRHIPIIMLTVQDKEMDKVTGLEMGADDYMTKPFGQRELLARIKALIRRFDRSNEDNKLLKSGVLLVDLDKHLVRIKDRVIPMTPKEFDLLTLLMQNNKKALNRQNLLTSIWGYDAPGSSGTIDVHIRHLRRKLGTHGTKIKTILNFGYRFDG
ncbi:MAG: response regulator transcription factor [Elusimicrobia bacterium]|nr:response regulator transcription factor [Elusimicrobiota bacterium]